MKNLAFLAIFLIFEATAADLGLSGCGTYSFKGTPKMLEEEIVLILNEGSRSEIVLKMARTEEARIAPYLELMTSGVLHVGKVTGPRRGLLHSLSKLEYARPDPLNPTLNTYLILQKKEKCP
ncbi:MAG TPA: hypothetical protein VNJ08_07030 [Bacteriovoracaceae bacterium]|nr:hypothetical protein [Bacteriovoracaceae bacterium]